MIGLAQWSRLCAHTPHSNPKHPHLLPSSCAELGLGTQSDDGLTNAEFRVLMDRVGSSELTSYAINLEYGF